MARPFVVVATPCFGQLVNQSYMLSILKLLKAAESGAFELDILLLGGDSLITRSRAVLVSRCLDNERATHLFFVDADISFETEQFLRLLSFDEDFAAAAYPLKQIDWRALPQRVVRGESLTAAGLSYVGELCEGEEAEQRGDFLTARHAGTGFQLIKRHVLTRLISAHPELKFSQVQTLSNEKPTADNLYALFECMIDRERGTYLSEDYAFCRRWRAIGGKIWLDTQSRLTHSGLTHYDGDFGPRVRAQEQMRDLAQAARRIA